MHPSPTARIERFSHFFLTLADSAESPRIHRVFCAEQEQLRCFFGLRADPFPDETDPDCYRGNPEHDRSHDTLARGIADGIPFGMVTARGGLGKGCLARRLRQSLSENNRATVELKVEPGLTVEVLLGNILSGLDRARSCREQTAPPELWRLLREALGPAPGSGSIRLLLLLTDAQLLTAELWRTLKVLSDLGTTRRAPVTTLLFGEDTLRDLLRGPDAGAIRQRIFVRERLRPLTSGETGEFIRQRLDAVLFAGHIFTAEACEAVFQATDGVYREINALAANALLRAFRRGEKNITADGVRGTCPPE